MHKWKPGTTIGVITLRTGNLYLYLIFIRHLSTTHFVFPTYFHSLNHPSPWKKITKNNPSPTTLPRKNIFVLYACFTFWGLFAIHSLKQNTQNLLEMMKWWWYMMKSNKVDYITLTFHLFFLIYSFPHILWNYLISIMI